MCGIYCCIRASGSYAASNDSVDPFHVLSEQLRSVNATRGPDAKRSHTVSLDAPSLSRSPSTSGVESVKLEVEFFASELRLRGRTPVVQPHHQDGDVLCWNGEVFEGLEISADENDGAKLFEHLRSVCEPNLIAPLLGGIEGPYAFAFYHSSSDKLYFARDPLGRRSLLIHRPTLPAPYLILASVSVGSHPAYEFEELSTEAIFCLDIGRLRRSSDLLKGFDDSLSIVPRRAPMQGFTEIPKVNTTLPPEDWPCLSTLNHGDVVPEIWLDTVDRLISYLHQSVMLRVRDTPLPPGGQGNARIAVLFSGGIDSTILAFLAHHYIPIDEPIDLLNVAFENPRKIENRAATVPNRESMRHHRAAKVNEADKGRTSYSVPDRVTGLEELDELRKLCPVRVWNFVEVDVPYEESQEATPIIEATMWPSRTIMDLSLAMALYFASQGVGRIRVSSKPLEFKPYTSYARVLLNGVGSDELLGGYGRHRTAFIGRGWQGVIDELQLDLDRIPTRNLGRDDRIISLHGKETRHPFLSLSVVSFLAGLPVHLKLDPRLDAGRGDKILLRLAARKLGLVEASTRKKRAMQFGSHSARMEVEGRGRKRPNGQDYIRIL